MSKSKKRLSLSKTAALLGPAVIAGDRAMSAEGDPGSRFLHGLSEWGSMYFGYNANTDSFDWGNLGIGYGFAAGAIAFTKIKQALGNPSTPDVLPVTF